MQEQDGLNPAEREFELALKSVVPAAARIDSIGAAFAAGARSARCQVRIWQSATVLMLAVTAGSWLIPARRDGVVQPSGRADYKIARGTPAARFEPLPQQSVLVLHAAVRKKGLDGLPAPHLPAAAIIRARDTVLTSRGDS